MKKLTTFQKSAVWYHDIFDYPLNEDEIQKWDCGVNLKSDKKIIYKKELYLVENKEHAILKRKNNQFYSKAKLKIAHRASNAISKIPSVRAVALSGSLAMNNATEDSDIDLLIITSSGNLWITRPLVYLFLKIRGYKIRKPKDMNEKDKLCLNLWMDQSDLEIKERNIYTAHELAQLVPLVNKGNCFEDLLVTNKWILDFWPNAVLIDSAKYKQHRENKMLCTMFYALCSVINKLAFLLQKQYMRQRVTRETVTETRAFFHPKDWGKDIAKKLKV